MLIDAHVHLFPPAQREARAALASRDATFAAIYADPQARMADAAGLLAALAAAKMDGAVAAGFAFSAAADIEAQNAYLAEAAREHPTIAALATVNPALPGWQRAAERALDAGAAGLGELRPADQGWDPLGPEAGALCELAAEWGRPLLWHVSEPVGHAYPGKAGGISPIGLITLATAHPETKMVAAHLGGGLSFYLQMPEVRDAIRNVYFDTAAVPLLYAIESIARLVDLTGEHRVLFASDFPLLSPARQLEKVRSVLPGSAARAVCGGNADSLFFHPQPRRRV
jgi:uncharacterized protein